MKLVGSVLRGNVDDRAGIASKLGIEVTCNNSEFLSGIDVRRSYATGDSRYVGIVVVDTVNQEVVVAFALAVDTETAKRSLRLSRSRSEKNQSIRIATQ